MADPDQQLDEVLEKVCSARGWNINNYTASNSSGQESIKFETRISQIKDNVVMFSPRTQDSLLANTSSKFTVYLPDGQKKR
jgi:hypothetical protein